MRLDTKDRTIEIKDLSEEGQFSGYASVFGNVDAYNDIVEKGAFTRSLKNNRVKMLFNHDPSKIIGVWEEMEEDEKGLKVRGKLLKSIQLGAEMLELIKAGAIEGLSIGFRTVKAVRDDKTFIRKLMEVDLQEISLVTFPANVKAKVNRVKSSKVELERILRDAGLPNSFAKSVVRFGYDAAIKSTQNSRDLSIDVESIFKD